jgi:hypothetical protein
MQIDPHLIPTTFDAVHLGLAALVVILVLLQIILLSVAAIVLLRRKPPVVEPVVIQPVPVEVTLTPAKEIPKPAEPVRPEKPEKPEPVIVKQALPDAALQLLGLLQKEARFIDFVEENIGPYSDAEIGAAARIVHDGCRKVLNEFFELEPIRPESENTRLTLPKGFDASSIRLMGNVVGEPPFTGTLIHRGWRSMRVKLPKISEGHNVNIIAQAEVEL